MVHCGHTTDLHLNKQGVCPRQAHAARSQNGGGCLGLGATGLAQWALGMRQTITHLHRVSAQGVHWRRQAISMSPLSMRPKAHKKLFPSPGQAWQHKHEGL
jgi:hypothetical protein